MVLIESKPGGKTVRSERASQDVRQHAIFYPLSTLHETERIKNLYQLFEKENLNKQKLAKQN